MHVDGAVALAREAVAEAEEGALASCRRASRRPRSPRPAAGDRRGPGGVAAAQMRLELARAVGVALEVVPIGVAVAEEHVHDRAGERAVGAGAHEQGHVGLLHGGVHVDVDGDDLGAALLAGPHRVGHHVDLGDRVGAPDHDAVGLRHLARIGPGELARAGDVAGPGHVGADGGVLAGVFLDVAQAVDAVAHHEAHGARIVVGPDGLGAVAALGLQEPSATRSSASSQEIRSNRPRPSGPCASADGAAGPG